MGRELAQLGKRLLPWHEDLALMERARPPGMVVHT